MPITFLLRQPWNQEMMCQSIRRMERKRFVVIVVYDCHDMDRQQPQDHVKVSYNYKYNYYYYHYHSEI